MVGQLQIDYTPPWLKNFAIREFGGHDKEILVGGILVVLALFAAVLGVLAMRRLGYGLAGIGLFAAVGVFAAATRPAATAGQRHGQHARHDDRSRGHRGRAQPAADHPGRGREGPPGSPPRSTRWPASPCSPRPMPRSASSPTPRRRA
jgi:hypothetical protein